MYVSLWFLCALVLSKQVQSFLLNLNYNSKYNALKQRKHYLHAFSQRVYEGNDRNNPNVRSNFKPLKIIPSVRRFFQDRIFRLKRFLATFLLFIVQRLVGIKGQMDILWLWNIKIEIEQNLVRRGSLVFVRIMLYDIVCWKNPSIIQFNHFNTYIKNQRDTKHEKTSRLRSWTLWTSICIYFGIGK